VNILENTLKKTVLRGTLYRRGLGEEGRKKQERNRENFLLCIEKSLSEKKGSCGSIWALQGRELACGKLEKSERGGTSPEKGGQFS